jgi:glyoxylase-like metal-dependent hydrolase (beta-lactamase superfamily II)
MEVQTMKLRVCLTIVALCSGLAVLLGAHAEQAPEPPIKVQALTDYLIYFFDGRRPAERYAKDWNWFDDAAMKLGVGTYAIHSGDQAIVYDTFTSVPQAKFVRDYLTKMGIKKFTVVHSHWHLDHIAGDSVYDDSDVSLPRQPRTPSKSRKRTFNPESCGARRRSIPSAFPT